LITLDNMDSGPKSHMGEKIQALFFGRAKGLHRDTRDNVPASAIQPALRVLNNGTDKHEQLVNPLCISGGRHLVNMSK